MGGGKGSPGPSPQVSSGLQNAENTLTQIAGQQAGNAEQLYQLTEPGLVQSENFYSTLASGDPGAIMRAIAPTAQAASEASSGAKSNIMANAPAGGEKNLALEETDVNRAKQIASTASGASIGANNALGQIAGQGIGESISSAGTAVGAESAGASALSSLGGLQLQGQQLQMEQKGQSLGSASMMSGKGAGAGAAGGAAGKGGGAAADAAKGLMLA